jgi:hypothetical protein
MVANLIKVYCESYKHQAASVEQNTVRVMLFKTVFVHKNGRTILPLHCKQDNIYLSIQTATVYSFVIMSNTSLSLPSLSV